MNDGIPMKTIILKENDVYMLKGEKDLMILTYKCGKIHSRIEVMKGD